MNNTKHVDAVKHKKPKLSAIPHLPRISPYTGIYVPDAGYCTKLENTPAGLKVVDAFGFIHTIVPDRNTRGLKPRKPPPRCPIPEYDENSPWYRYPSVVSSDAAYLLANHKYGIWIAHWMRAAVKTEAQARVYAHLLWWFDMKQCGERVGRTNGFGDAATGLQMMVDGYPIHCVGMSVAELACRTNLPKITAGDALTYLQKRGLIIINKDHHELRIAINARGTAQAYYDTEHDKVAMDEIINPQATLPPLEEVETYLGAPVKVYRQSQELVPPVIKKNWFETRTRRRAMGYEKHHPRGVRVRWIVSYIVGHDPGPARFLCQLLFWFGGTNQYYETNQDKFKVRTRVRVDGCDQAYKSVREWAEEMYTTPSMVQRWIKILEAKGLLIVAKGVWKKRQTLRFRFNSDQLTADLQVAVGALVDYKFDDLYKYTEKRETGQRPVLP